MSSEFFFRGEVPASKSILNRLLILQSFRRDLVIIGDSDADDVRCMRGALRALERGESADCGAAGTTLRFLALRASRIPGRHVLKGSSRLLARPQGELISILAQLGCRAELSDGAIIVEGEGWKVPKGGLRIRREISSQFASAVVLSAWGLERPLRLGFEGEAVSETYFAMTLDIVRRAGLAWRRDEEGSIELPREARIATSELNAELDISSAFAIAALAAVSGRAEILQWPDRSLQADAAFVDILSEMGCEIEIRDRVLKIARPESGRLRAVARDLRLAPDLFPVLAVLCARAEGRSILFGAPQLAHKESNRIARVADLVRAIGAQVHERADGLEIIGGKSQREFRFNPDHDHRLAMAAAVARAAGAAVAIEDRAVVNKSFPSFWSIAEATP